MQSTLAQVGNKAHWPFLTFLLTHNGCDYIPLKETCSLTRLLWNHLKWTRSLTRLLWYHVERSVVSYPIARTLRENDVVTYTVATPCWGVHAHPPLLDFCRPMYHPPVAYCLFVSDSTFTQSYKLSYDFSFEKKTNNDSLLK